MFDLYTWATPNGRKVSIALEELGLAYTVHPINIGRGAQFEPEFVAISPESKIPALVDRDVLADGKPLAVFESGAILIYLAEKTGQLLPASGPARAHVLAWTFHQAGGVGPLVGQWGHFDRLRPEGPAREYGLARYSSEAMRFLATLDRQLAVHPFIAGADYSIADIMNYPWVAYAQSLRAKHAPDQDLPRVARWAQAVGARPAVKAGMAVPKLRAVV